ncbi:hypothetical protein TRIUR3_31662 [Triticum urartu]|uniref:Uncharacterized protein n=1 Tax=Triticum urartu TaxID=4572 RepID=M7YHB2_TRIUA|nr:hypothetical protein TRIUR3_31662 [Triticum urartu]
MAIDHESPFKELRLKNRRIMGGGAPEPDEEEAEAQVIPGNAPVCWERMDDCLLRNMVLLNLQSSFRMGQRLILN